MKTSADTAQNVRNGKSLTAAIRLAGSLQMLERAESDVDSILGDKALHSQQELVNFMIKVTARKKAEDPAMIPLRAFAMGSEFESLLPGRSPHRGGALHGVQQIPLSCSTCDWGSRTK